MGVMAEVNASFQKLTHAVIGQRHGLLRLFVGGRVSAFREEKSHRTAVLGPMSACEMGLHITAGSLRRKKQSVFGADYCDFETGSASRSPSRGRISVPARSFSAG